MKIIRDSKNLKAPFIDLHDVKDKNKKWWKIFTVKIEEGEIFDKMLQKLIGENKHKYATFLWCLESKAIISPKNYYGEAYDNMTKAKQRHLELCSIVHDGKIKDVVLTTH